MKSEQNPSEKEIRVLSVMAHQDDFEFTAGGLFALLRRHYGSRARLRILATTRGASGHHRLSPEATYARRHVEACKSAGLLGAEYELMRGLDGHPLIGQFFIDRNTLGGLWNHIREFRPDFLFCPPVVSDPLAGVHIDHELTAQAVRLIAYQLCVPNAYPTLGAAVSTDIVSPVIVNVDDGYSRERQYHVRVDISAFYEQKTAMTLCHESQIYEWLPFTLGRSEGTTEKDFRAEFLARHEAVNRRFNMPIDQPAEYFRITRWGRQATLEDVEAVFPSGQIEPAYFDGLKQSTSVENP